MPCLKSSFLKNKNGPYFFFPKFELKRIDFKFRMQYAMDEGKMSKILIELHLFYNLRGVREWDIRFMYAHTHAH